jgi:hypothetical protein
MNELSKSARLDEPEDAFEEHLFFNLVYCSQVSPGIEQADVDAIVATARRFNPILGITGILVFGAGVFFQWIEGPKAKVLDLVSRIEADVRHEEMAILSSDEEIRERIFPTWDMELVDTSDIQEVLRDALETAHDEKSIAALHLLLDRLEKTS